MGISATKSNVIGIAEIGPITVAVRDVDESAAKAKQGLGRQTKESEIVESPKGHADRLPTIGESTIGRIPLKARTDLRKRGKGCITSAVGGIEEAPKVVRGIGVALIDKASQAGALDHARNTDPNLRSFALNPPRVFPKPISNNHQRGPHLS
jgi:hypothetical protein